MKGRQRHCRGVPRGLSQTARPGQETAERCMVGPVVGSGQGPGRIRGVTQGGPGTSPTRGSPRNLGVESAMAPTCPPVHPSWRSIGSSSSGKPDARQWAGRAEPPSPWAASSATWPSQALTRQPSTMVLSGRQTIRPFQARAGRLASPTPLFLSGSCK